MVVDMNETLFDQARADVLRLMRSTGFSPVAVMAGLKRLERVATPEAFDSQCREWGIDIGEFQKRLTDIEMSGVDSDALAIRSLRSKLDIMGLNI
jgi:hypothetical protein